MSKANIKPFIDMYNWNGINIQLSYVIMNILFLKEKSGNCLIALYVSGGIIQFTEKGEVKVHVYKSNSHTCLNIINQ